MRIVFIPYTEGVSNSIRNLRAKLKEMGRVTKRIDRSYRRRQEDVFINWGDGSRHWDMHLGTPYIANPRTSDATNKLHTFNAFKSWNGRQRDQLNLLPYFTRRDDAAQHMRETGKAIVCRTLLTAREGRGIVVADTVDQLVPAPLYVEYKKKRAEYRVHVFDGDIIDITQKRKRRGAEVDTRIRNANAGWVFTRNNIEPLPEDLKSQAQKAINALSLDFGAVDLIYNSREEKTYALEVNTAPGIEGQTVEEYANAISRYADR